MAWSLEELRQMPDSELTAQHDKLAVNTQVGVNYFLAELARRDQDRQTATMVRLTWAIAAMTAIILLATIANIGLVLVLAFRQ